MREFYTRKYLKYYIILLKLVKNQKNFFSNSALAPSTFNLFFSPLEYLNIKWYRLFINQKN